MLMWIALFVLGYGLVSKRLERTMVTPPMVFVLLGLLFGGGSLASLGMQPPGENSRNREICSELDES